MNIVNFRQQVAKLCVIFLVISMVPVTQVAAQNVVKNKAAKDAQEAGNCSSKSPGNANDCPQALVAEPQLAQSVTSSPLSFYVNDDTSTAMYYNGLQQFYGQNAEGVFIWVNGLVYGPGYVPAGLGTYAYTPVSNSLSGTGTSANPWKVTTVVDVGDSGLRIQQEIKYVDGDAYVTYSWRVSNTTNNDISYSLFHAADLYTENNDYGYGYYDGSTGAIGGYNASRTFYQYLQPITPSSHFFEGFYGDTWQRIGDTFGPGAGFDDTYRPNDYIDNSAGLQWNRALSANNVDIISDYGVFNTRIGGITCYSLDIGYAQTRGTVTQTPAENCPSGRGYTYNTVVTLHAFPTTGYKFTRWDGDANGTSTIANVVITGNKIVAANFDLILQSMLPPVVLVHGWHGKPFDSTDTCSSNTVAYHVTDPDNIPASIIYDFGVFAKNLVLIDHRDVWIVRVATGPFGTPLLEENANCLKQQLIDIRARSGAERVVLIGHSMGGVVSRAYIESSEYLNDVVQLVTLGSPHGGTSYLYDFCLNPFDDAACQMTPWGMRFFNSAHHKRDRVVYDLIGGNLTPGLFGDSLRKIDGLNDGAVGVNSGMGLDYPGFPGFPKPVDDIKSGELLRFAIRASHSSVKLGPVTDLFWFPSFFNQLSGLIIDKTTPTDTYQCVRQLLGITGGTCPSVVTPLIAMPTDIMFGAQATPRIKGQILPGDVITLPVPIDTIGQSNFNLTWTTGSLSFTLIDPNGTIIDPAYANTHPNEVAYMENSDTSSELFANYAFVASVPGQYYLTISAINVSNEGAEYSVSILVDSPRTLAVETDQLLYTIGTHATITATLEDAGAGLTGASVTALITKPGVVNDTLNLSDIGGGTYQGTYTIPNTPGYLGLTVIANGTDNGTAYARQTDSLLAVSPPTVQLTGAYSDVAIDDDSNGKYEALAINVGLDVAQAGDYLVSGDLVSGNSLVAHYVGSHSFVNTGNNTITMLFNGDDIRQSGINGPYTLTNLTIADQQNGGLPAIWQAANVWITGAYNYQDLAATCFVLNLTSNPSASGTITPTPAPNCNGGLQYTSDSEVTLTAAPNSGYHFTGWSGDLNGLPNPAVIEINADKSVMANFESNPIGGAGGDTTGVFRPSNGLVYMKNKNETGFADIALNYGLPGDYPVVGDWDGNGTTTVGIYRGNTFFLRNENTIGFATIVFDFGQVGDQPIAGDWDGDGVDTIGVIRPSLSQFFLRNSNDAGPADMTFVLGNPGDVGVAGDWNGDGLDSTGVFRPANGIIYLKDQNTTGFADYALNYGIPGDKPVMGDWNDDGIDTIGVYRNGLFYLRNENTIGFAEIIFGLGNPGDMPIAGNWDGVP